MSVEYQILIGYAAFFAAVYLVVLAVLKFSKAKKKPKIVTTLSAHWFFVLITVAFVAMIHMFAYNMTKDLFASLLPSKQVGGKDVVFEVGGKNVTTDEFYTELYKYYGDYSVYVNFKRAVIDGSVKTTTEIKNLIKTTKTDTVAYWNQVMTSENANYGTNYTYDDIALYFLNQSGYSSVSELDAYIAEIVKTEKMNTAYIDAHMDEFYSTYAAANKPRVVSQILILMTDPKNPTADEKDRLKAVQDALAGGMSFEDAVKKYSEDTQTNQKAGLLGFMDKNTSYEPNFLAAALTLNEGQTSAWVVTSYGYHLIKMNTSGLDDLKKYPEFYTAILTANPKLAAQILWAKAQELHVNFNDNTELEAAVKKYLGLETGA